MRGGILYRAAASNIFYSTLPVQASAVPVLMSSTKLYKSKQRRFLCLLVVCLCASAPPALQRHGGPMGKQPAHVVRANKARREAAKKRKAAARAESTSGPQYANQVAAQPNSVADAVKPAKKTKKNGVGSRGKSCCLSGARPRPLGGWCDTSSRGGSGEQQQAAASGSKRRQQAAAAASGGSKRRQQAAAASSKQRLPSQCPRAPIL